MAKTLIGRESLDTRRETGRRAKQEGQREIIRLLDEVDRLKAQLQWTVGKNGMLEQQIAVNEQCSREKQMTMSKKTFQL